MALHIVRDSSRLLLLSLFLFSIAGSFLPGIAVMGEMTCKQCKKKARKFLKRKKKSCVRMCRKSKFMKENSCGKKCCKTICDNKESDPLLKSDHVLACQQVEVCPVSGCYGSKTVNDAGYQHGACDCSMTEDECKAENPSGAPGSLPVWTEGCSGLCVCEEVGEGCYKGAPTHQCDCSPEMCKGGEEKCEETAGYTWTNQCGSCQCPTLPACKPRGGGGGGGDDDDDDSSSGYGCYEGAPTHTCDCSDEMCKGGKDKCENAGYTWTDTCSSCTCP